MDRMFEGLGEVSDYQVRQWKNMVNKMTTIMLFMAISIMVFVQSICHKLSIAQEDFVAMSAGISGFYRGIAWELTSHCGCGWLWKQLKLLALFLINKIDLIIMNLQIFLKSKSGLSRPNSFWVACSSKLGVICKTKPSLQQKFDTAKMFHVL